MADPAAQVLIVTSISVKGSEVSSDFILTWHWTKLVLLNSTSMVEVEVQLYVFDSTRDESGFFFAGTIEKEVLGYFRQIHA